MIPTCSRDLWLRAPENLIDVRRYEIEPGQYELIIEITDKNNEVNLLQFRSNLEVEDLSSKASISDICLLANVETDKGDSQFSKNGLYLEAASVSRIWETLRKAYVLY